MGVCTRERWRVQKKRRGERTSPLLPPLSRSLLFISSLSVSFCVFLRPPPPDSFSLPTVFLINPLLFYTPQSSVFCLPSTFFSLSLSLHPHPTQLTLCPIVIHTLYVCTLHPRPLHPHLPSFYFITLRPPQGPTLHPLLSTAVVVFLVLFSGPSNFSFSS